MAFSCAPVSIGRQLAFLSDGNAGTLDAARARLSTGALGLCDLLHRARRVFWNGLPHPSAVPRPGHVAHNLGMILYVSYVLAFRA
jgi:hypothetical protein